MAVAAFPMQTLGESESLQNQSKRTTPPWPTYPNHEEAARKALDGLRQVASKDAMDPNVATYAKLLGFSSAEEMTAAIPGSPIRIYSVDAKGLRKFAEDGNLQTLLVDTRQVIYPLLIKGQARSSLTVAELEPQSWRVTIKGLKPVDVIEPYRRSSSNFLVTIGFLNLHFLGDQKSGQFILIPISDINIPGLDLRPGIDLPAESIFRQLALNIKTYKEPLRSPDMSHQNGITKP